MKTRDATKRNGLQTVLLAAIILATGVLLTSCEEAGADGGGDSGVTGDTATLDTTALVFHLALDGNLDDEKSDRVGAAKTGTGSSNVGYGEDRHGTADGALSLGSVFIDFSGSDSLDLSGEDAITVSADFFIGPPVQSVWTYPTYSDGDRIQFIGERSVDRIRSISTKIGSIDAIVPPYTERFLPTVVQRERCTQRTTYRRRSLPSNQGRSDTRNLFLGILVR
jgi:hypothetical protein